MYTITKVVSTLSEYKKSIMAKMGRPRVAKKNALVDSFSVRLRPKKDGTYGTLSIVQERAKPSGYGKPSWTRREKSMLEDSLFFRLPVSTVPTPPPLIGLVISIIPRYTMGLPEKMRIPGITRPMRFHPVIKDLAGRNSS